MDEKVRCVFADSSARIRKLRKTCKYLKYNYDGFNYHENLNTTNQDLLKFKCKVFNFPYNI